MMYLAKLLWNIYLGYRVFSFVKFISFNLTLLKGLIVTFSKMYFAKLEYLMPSGI